jgi:hypothetical protein
MHNKFGLFFSDDVGHGIWIFARFKKHNKSLANYTKNTQRGIHLRTVILIVTIHTYPPCVRTNQTFSKFN